MQSKAIEKNEEQDNQYLSLLENLPFGVTICNGSLVIKMSTEESDGLSPKETYRKLYGELTTAFRMVDESANGLVSALPICSWCLVPALMPSGIEFAKPQIRQPTEGSNAISELIEFANDDRARAVFEELLPAMAEVYFPSDSFTALCGEGAKESAYFRFNELVRVLRGLDKEHGFHATLGKESAI